MVLSQYIATSPGNGKRLAEALGISPSYLSQLASGHRPTSAEMALRIERATMGAVPVQESCPGADWAVVGRETIEN